MSFALLAAQGLSNLGGSVLQNEMDKENAREQNQHNVAMSNTAHTREVQDLMNAGLNPLLSVMGGSGASTPTGAKATAPQIKGPSVLEALSARKVSEETKLTKEKKNESIKGQKQITEQTRLTAANALVAELKARALQEVDTSLRKGTPKVVDTVRDLSESINKTRRSRQLTDKRRLELNKRTKTKKPDMNIFGKPIQVFRQ